MNKFVYSSDGYTVIGGVSLNDHTGEPNWYTVNWNPPSTSENDIVKCIGFIRNGNAFDAIFETSHYDEDATEEDKDAALEALGVDMTEG